MSGKGPQQSKPASAKKPAVAAKPTKKAPLWESWIKTEPAKPEPAQPKKLPRGAEWVAADIPGGTFIPAKSEPAQPKKLPRGAEWVAADIPGGTFIPVHKQAVIRPFNKRELQAQAERRKATDAWLAAAK